MSQAFAIMQLLVIVFCLFFCCCLFFVFVCVFFVCLFFCFVFFWGGGLLVSWLVGFGDICERFWQYDQLGIKKLDRTVDDISFS